MISFAALMFLALFLPYRIRLRRVMYIMVEVCGKSVAMILASLSELAGRILMLLRYA